MGGECGEELREGRGGGFRDWDVESGWSAAIIQRQTTSGLPSAIISYSLTRALFDIAAVVPTRLLDFSPDNPDPLDPNLDSPFSTPFYADLDLPLIRLCHRAPKGIEERHDERAGIEQGRD